MSDRYPLLFKPLRVGPYTLKNRITMAPLFLAYGTREGNVSSLQVEHYRDMARSGAAMIVTENVIVNSRRSWFGRLLRADEDNFVPGLTQIAGAIKEHGAVACCQLGHAGRFAQVEKAVSASAVSAFGAPPPEEMSPEEIRQTHDDYVQTARRAIGAGFDMVEIHGGTGYLPAQFVSPRTNLRNDQYGGGLENRMRFALELVRAVIKELGSNHPVGYRFMADEWIPGGFQPEEARIFARHLAEEGVAYLSVTAGTYESMFTPERMEQSLQEAYMADLAAAVKEEVAIPVIAAGRIATPGVAEGILSEGRADLVGLGRVLLADPRWPEKALGGNEKDIIACKEGCDACIQFVMKQQPVICSRFSREQKRKVTEIL